MSFEDTIKFWDDNVVKNHCGGEIQRVKDFFVEKNIKQISFLDIGANTGKFYEELSKDFEIEYCVLVEPMKELFEYIQVKYNNKNNIFLYNIALSNKQGNFKLNTDHIDYWKKNLKNKVFDPQINLGISKITNENGDTETYTMTFFWNNFLSNKNFDFIKIDTESKDLQIIEELSFCLSKNTKKPLILFENNYFMSSGLSAEDSNKEAQKIVDIFCIANSYKNINISKDPCILYPKK